MRLTGRRPKSWLLHVGPHKTGTTTVQWAFHGNRDALKAHDVHYVGDGLQPTAAVQALTGHGPSAQNPKKGVAQWDELLAEANAQRKRVVLSSEFLCEADDQVAARIAKDIGKTALTVVITLRPLAKILPSQWQQAVKTGVTRELDDWMDDAMRTFADPNPPRVWLRHRHDRLVERWAEIVGPENVVVIIPDPKDHDHLLREFSALLDLPDGVLVPVDQVNNRSLTWQEAEAIRGFNVALQELNAVRAEEGRKPLVVPVRDRLAAWSRLTRSPAAPDEVRLQLPSGYDERVREIGAQYVERITSSGVRVVGNLDELLWMPSRDGSEATQPAAVSTELAGKVAAVLFARTRGHR